MCNWSPEKEERVGTEKIFEEIMPGFFPLLQAFFNRNYDKGDFSAFPTFQR